MPSQALQHDPVTGLVQPATFISSPNFNERKPEDIISLLVIHNISLPPEQYDNDYVTDFFLNRLDPTIHPYFATIYTRKVSAHFYITRQGELIQYVSTLHRAWHAGESSFQGRAACNDYSIGIELAGSDYEEFTPVQYQVLANLVRCIQNGYQAITRDRIVGHSDIAPGRKTDPGKFFDWNKLWQQVDEVS